VAQVALALVLVVGAGGLLSSFVALVSVDPGYDPANVLTMRVPNPDLAGIFSRPLTREAVEEQSMESLSPELRERVLAGEAVAAKKKGVVGSGPAVDSAAVEALRSRVVLSCSFCHDRMQRGDAVFCAACLAPHHQDCFEGHGACSMPGCDETETVRPSSAGEPTRRRRRSGRRW